MALGRDDYAFITIGSMTADARYGDDDHAPELGPRQARRRLDAVGNPGAQGTGLRSAERLQRQRGRKQVGVVHADDAQSAAGRAHRGALRQRSRAPGGLMTFKDSSWLMSIVVPHPPHFAGQPDGRVHALGIRPVRRQHGRLHREDDGASATGQEILTELIHHLRIRGHSRRCATYHDGDSGDDAVHHQRVRTTRS